MRQTRVYVPLSRTGLRDLTDTRSLAGTTRLAFAVTQDLQRAHPGADEEDLEYHALCDAADAALTLRERPGDRLVLAAADVEPGWVEPGWIEPCAAVGPVSGVRITQPVPLRRIVSFHVDEEGATTQEGRPVDLLWYDATELDEVVSMFS